METYLKGKPWVSPSGALCVLPFNEPELRKYMNTLILKVKDVYPKDLVKALCVRPRSSWVWMSFAHVHLEGIVFLVFSVLSDSYTPSVFSSAGLPKPWRQEFDVPSWAFQGLCKSGGCGSSPVFAASVEGGFLDGGWAGHWCTDLQLNIFIGFLSLWKSGSLFLVPCLAVFPFCLLFLSNSNVLAFAWLYFISLLYQEMM